MPQTKEMGAERRQRALAKAIKEKLVSQLNGFPQPRYPITSYTDSPEATAARLAYARLLGDNRIPSTFSRVGPRVPKTEINTVGPFQKHYGQRYSPTTGEYE